MATSSETPPMPTLLRTATAPQLVPALLAMIAGRPPRPAMRARRTMSYCATRRDCCMSVTCVCTRASLLWKSNRARPATMTSAVMNSATVISRTVKPRSPAVRRLPAPAARGSCARMAVALLETLQVADRGAAVRPLGADGGDALDLHRGLDDMDRRGFRAAVQGIVEGLVVVHVVGAVLAKGGDAGPDD